MALDFPKLLFYKIDFVSLVLALQKRFEDSAPVLQNENESIFRKLFFFLTEVIKNEVISVGPNPIWPGLCLLLYKGETWTQRQQEQKGVYMKPEEVRKGFPMIAMTSIASSGGLKLFQVIQFGAQLAAQGIQLPSKMKLLIVFPLPLFISFAFPLKSYPFFFLFVTWFLVACAVFEL